MNRGVRLAILAFAIAFAGGVTAHAGPHARRAGPSCGGNAALRAAASANAASLDSLAVDLFGRPETGWAIYAPAVAQEIRTRCAPDRAGFARALERWQARRALPATAVMDADTLTAMKSDWQDRRPFFRLRDQGTCPPPPADRRLAQAKPSEVLEGGKPVRLRRPALRAWRRMAAAARHRDPAIAADPDALKLFSGFRDPEDDAARCASENNCQGLVRAACSAHRTGLALDLMVGAAPGFTADSSADANRLYQTRTPAYRWLVRNARRFGFVNYVFEPWHWEWTGERP